MSEKSKILNERKIIKILMTKKKQISINKWAKQSKNLNKWKIIVKISMKEKLLQF